ncbi:hypothetical protein VTK26DRAFT_391 [Humicola hyalothermophila]
MWKNDWEGKKKLGVGERFGLDAQVWDGGVSFVLRGRRGAGELRDGQSGIWDVPWGLGGSSQWEASQGSVLGSLHKSSRRSCVPSRKELTHWVGWMYIAASVHLFWHQTNPVQAPPFSCAQWTHQCNKRDEEKDSHIHPITYQSNCWGDVDLTLPGSLTW